MSRPFYSLQIIFVEENVRFTRCPVRLPKVLPLSRFYVKDRDVASRRVASCVTSEKSRTLDLVHAREICTEKRGGSPLARSSPRSTLVNIMA